MAKIEDYTTLILKECASQNLSNYSDLIRAMVAVESEYNPNAMRYERNYVHLYQEANFAKIQKITLETEKALQRFSYGLGQLMGASCRWLGFSGHLPKLLDPEINLFWMCRYFKKVCSPQVYTNDQIAVYNGGQGALITKAQTGLYPERVEIHVQKVLAALSKIQDNKPKVFGPN